MKRFLFITIAVAVVAGVIAFGYYLRFLGQGGGGAGGTGGTLPTSTGAGVRQPTGGTPNIGQSSSTISGTLAVVGGSTTILDYFVGAGGAVTAVGLDGSVIQLDGAQQPVTLSPTTVSGANAASFSADGQGVLVVGGESRALFFSAYDIPRRAWTRLPTSTIAAVWSPISRTVAYLVTTSVGSALTTLDLGSPAAKPVELLPTHQQDLLLQWPSANRILLVDRGNSRTAGSVWSFELSTKTLTPLILDQPGLATLWNPLGHGLVLKNGGRTTGGVLGLISGWLGSTQQLNFLTLPSKCVFQTIFSSSTATGTVPLTTTTTKRSVAAITTTNSSSVREFIDCAVPSDSEALDTNRLPDAYDEMALLTEDNLYQINLGDGNTTAIPGGSAARIDAVQLKIFGGRLYFINRYDRKLYSVPLL